MTSRTKVETRQKKFFKRLERAFNDVAKLLELEGYFLQIRDEQFNWAVMWAYEVYVSFRLNEKDYSWAIYIDVGNRPRDAKIKLVVSEFKKAYRKLEAL